MKVFAAFLVGVGGVARAQPRVPVITGSGLVQVLVGVDGSVSTSL